MLAACPPAAAAKRSPSFGARRELSRAQPQASCWSGQRCIERGLCLQEQHLYVCVAKTVKLRELRLLGS